MLFRKLWLPQFCAELGLKSCLNFNDSVSSRNQGFIYGKKRNGKNISDKLDRFSLEINFQFEIKAFLQGFLESVHVLIRP